MPRWRLLPPLSSSVTELFAASPTRVPPILYSAAVQVTTTLLTSALPTVPVPIVTTQFCEGLVGWVSTVTA